MEGITMPRPTGIRETKPRKRKIIIPGEASWKRLWSNAGYRSRGLSLELFKELASRPCYYCGAPPRHMNAFGSVYDHDKHGNGVLRTGTYEWWQEQWINANGVDKVVPTDNYKDLSNLVSCCRVCNFMKGVLGQDTFLDQIKRIYSHCVVKALVQQID